VRDNDKLEAETRSFPENCEVALPALAADRMSEIKSSYVSGHTSKFLVPGATEGLVASLSFADLKLREKSRENISMNPLRSAGGSPALSCPIANH